MGEAPRHPPHIHTTAAPAHETSDVSIRPLAIFLAWLTGSIVVVIIVCAWLFSVFEHSAERREPQPSPLAEAHPPTRGPLLQVSAREDLKTLRAREDQVLASAAWIDKDRQLARIPIDRAMQVVAQQGLPNGPPPPEDKAQPGSNDRAPLNPAANSPQGTGQTTPVQEGAHP
jgi:hypothetical protein